MKKATVAIIGGGLSGLTAADYLKNYADVVILEQGKEYEDRVIENGEEALIGLGGAGTLSGGKLCFPPASSGIWEKTSHLMPEFDSFHAYLSSNINSLRTFSLVNTEETSGTMQHKLYRTELVLQNAMHRFVGRQIKHLRNQGVTIRSRCKVERVLTNNESYDISFENENGECELLTAGYVMLATGRTSVPFLRSLFSLDRHHQPDLGIRITVNTAQPAFSKVGADVKIKQQIGDYLVRTFCVCCGGDSVKTATRGLVHYDGHFTKAITDITNLGLLARSSKYSGISAAESYLKSMQKYVDKEISLRDFMRFHSVLAKNSPYEGLFEVIAAFVSELYRNSFLLQNADEIPVMIPAIDNINPLVATDHFFESSMNNVFVVGDAAGVSRGFIQSMWSGYCASERIIEKITCAGMRLQGLQTA